MTTGFIGTGGIVEAIITGLYNHGGYSESILVSRRNEQRSDRLSRQFPTVEVIDDNQTIVDRCERIFIGVLPDQARALLPKLRFRKSHCVISLPAGLDLSTLATMVHPASSICRAVPMPPIEFGLGPIPVCPYDEDTVNLFNRVGNAMPIADESHLNALIASSAVMATFFALQASNARWLESRQVPPDVATAYVTSVFQALSIMAAKANAQELQQMSRECLTPGGLNEQVLCGAQRGGFIEGIQAEIDRAMNRLQGS